MKRSREEPVEDWDSDSERGGAHVELRPVAKITELDYDHDHDHGIHSTTTPHDQESTAAMRCSLPPHRDPITFRTYGEYEAHYNKFHTNRCLECRKNFPSEHLLGIHIEECHDPLVVVRRDKGEHTYSCFVEGCERKCLTHQKRRMHMIDKHMFPKNYFFAVTKEGIDGRRSLLIESGHRRRQSSISNHGKESRRQESLQAPTGKQENPRGQAGPTDKGAQKEDREETESHQKGDTEMEDLTGAMSSLQFVPPSVRFGRGRAGFVKK